jgi:hypothetical protein
MKAKYRASRRPVGNPFDGDDKQVDPGYAL